MSLMPSTKLHRDCTQMAHDIADSIAHQPGGYSWLHSLPHKGKHSPHVLIQKWSKLVYSTLFTSALHKAMLSACLSTDGTPTPQSKLLYTWLLKYVYSNSATKLYKDWLQLNRTL